MQVEFGERAGGAVFLEIGRRGADDAVVGGDLAGDERGILQFADADREIEALADDVDEAVGQVRVDLDIGVAGEEPAETGGDVQPAERRRHGNLQEPARLGVAAAHEILRLLAQAQDVNDTLEVARTRLGERQVARRALEQARAEPLLELADALGYDCRGKPHLAAGGRHVAGAGDACEYLQIANGSHVGRALLLVPPAASTSEKLKLWPVATIGIRLNSEHLYCCTMGTRCLLRSALRFRNPIPAIRLAVVV